MKHVLLIGFAAAMLVAGCKGVTVRGNDGDKVTVNQGSGDMTIETKDGETVKIDRDGDSWSANSTDGSEVKFEDGKVSGKNEKGEPFESGIATLSEADLGIPFYPGSKQMQYGSSRTETAEAVTLSMNRTTGDAPDKIVEFYKSKFKYPKTFTSNDSGMAQAQVGGTLADGGEVAIIAIRTKNETNTQIMMTVNRKKGK